MGVVRKFVVLAVLLIALGVARSASATLPPPPYDPAQCPHFGIQCCSSAQSSCSYYYQGFYYQGYFWAWYVGGDPQCGQFYETYCYIPYTYYEQYGYCWGGC